MKAKGKRQQAKVSYSTEKKCAPISPVLSFTFACCLLPFAFCLHSGLLPFYNSHAD